MKQFLGKAFLNSEEQREYDEHFRFQLECPECKKVQASVDRCSHRLNRWAAWQTSFQLFSTISHSTRTKTFCNLMETADVFNDSNKIEEYEKRMKKKKKETLSTTMATTVTSKLKSKPKPKLTGKDFRRKMNEGKLKMISEDSSDSDIEFKKDRAPLFSNKELESISKEKKKMRQKGSNSVSNKRVRVMKLPKVPKVEIDVSDIEDNQIGFCSQQTMPTLFDRCQMKRKRDTLATIEEQESEDEIQVEKKLKLDVSHSSSNEEEIFPSIFPSDDQGRTTDEFLPVSRKTPRKGSKTVVVEKETIPEAPYDLDLSSFNFETQHVEKLDRFKIDFENADIKMDEVEDNAERLKEVDNNSEKLDNFESNDDIFDKIESSHEKLEEVESNNKNLIEVERNDIEFEEIESNDKNFEGFDDDLDTMGDSLMKLFDEADDELFEDLPASPPMVSQFNHKKQQVGFNQKGQVNEHFRDEETDSKHIEEGDDSVPVEPDSPIFSKKKKKRNDIFEEDDQLFKEQDNEIFEVEDSPIFARKKKQRNVIFETQQTPTTSNHGQKHDENEDEDGDFACPKGNLSIFIPCFDLIKQV